MYDASSRVLMPVFSHGDKAEDTRRNVARRNLLLQKNTATKLDPSFRRASFIPASYYIRFTTDMLRNRRLGSIISYALGRTRNTARTIFLRSSVSPSEG